LAGALDKAGFVIKNVPLLPDFDRIRDRHRKILAFEAARVHREWYDAYADRYHEKTRALIDDGLRIAEEEYHDLLEETHRFRSEMQAAMIEHEIDAWITPSAPGTAPFGLDSTGDPVMNLPWTQAGLPTLTIPTGAGSNGLPLGTQVVGRWYRDEDLFLAGRAILEVWEAAA
jgi:Asp-tRNA(Asn)/Glu-tRNA(Gln) amidotransferase A subunit family amidase